MIFLAHLNKISILKANKNTFFYFLKKSEVANKAGIILLNAHKNILFQLHWPQCT